jgi:hypothetical protein
LLIVPQPPSGNLIVTDLKNDPFLIRAVGGTLSESSSAAEKCVYLKKHSKNTCLRSSKLEHVA